MNNEWLNDERGRGTSQWCRVNVSCWLSYLVQEEFESALDQGLRCTMENVHMRIRIAEEEAKRSKARGETRSKIMAGGNLEVWVVSWVTIIMRSEVLM